MTKRPFPRHVELEVTPEAFYALSRSGDGIWNLVLRHLDRDPGALPKSKQWAFRWQSYEERRERDLLRSIFKLASGVWIAVETYWPSGESRVRTNVCLYDEADSDWFRE